MLGYKDKILMRIVPMKDSSLLGEKYRNVNTPISPYTFANTMQNPIDLQIHRNDSIFIY